MFRTLIYPSSGACDYSVELPHWSYCSWFDVCWIFRCGWVGVVSVLQGQASACNTSYVFNMFRTLIYPSSGACDYSVELPHWSYCSWFVVCWSFGVVGLEWYPCCRLKLKAEACIMDTTPNQSHRNSNTHRTKNNTTNVVIQQNSRKFLMMDILMSETCRAHKKWKPATRIPLQPNHTGIPTHIEPRTIRPMW